MRQLQDELQCQYELSRTIRDTEIQSVPREEYEAVRLERDRYWNLFLILNSMIMHEYKKNALNHANQPKIVCHGSQK